MIIIFLNYNSEKYSIFLTLLLIAGLINYVVDNSYKLNLLSLIQIYCSTILLPYIKGEQYIEINQMNIGRNKHPNANNDMGENKVEEKILRSKERIYEDDGATITIVREFESGGSSILEQTISFLIDKMNKAEKESVNKDIDTEM